MYSFMHCYASYIRGETGHLSLFKQLRMRLQLTHAASCSKVKTLSFFLNINMFLNNIQVTRKRFISSVLIMIFSS